MLSIKSIKLPSIHVDFLLLCSCQVSSHSEYFIIISVSLMSHVGRKTPISDHRVQEPAVAVFINPARYIYIYEDTTHFLFVWTYISRAFSTLLQGDWKTVTSVLLQNSVILLNWRDIRQKTTKNSQVSARVCIPDTFCFEQ